MKFYSPNSVFVTSLNRHPLALGVPLIHARFRDVVRGERQEKEGWREQSRPDKLLGNLVSISISAALTNNRMPTRIPWIGLSWDYAYISASAFFFLD